MRVNPPSTPYADLSPDVVLAAVESVGLPTDGRLLALNSFENRVYQVGIDDAKPVVAKFYRGGRWSDAAIAEEHEFAHALTEAELPMVAPQVFSGESLLRHAGFRFAIYPRQGGRAPELESQENLAWMGRLLARIHVVGARRTFRARETLDCASLIDAPVRCVRDSALLPAALRESYVQVTSALRAHITDRFAANNTVNQLRLHGDCHPGNVLWTDAGPHFVDLDDARAGPAVQDLWMLATSAQSMRWLLDGYTEMRDFDPRELALVEPLRIMRQIHHAGWIAKRWDDPAFPRAFGFVAQARWWEQHLNDLREALAQLDDPCEFIV